MNPASFSNSTTIGNIDISVHEALTRTYAENELISLLQANTSGTSDFSRMNFGDLIDATFRMYRIKDEEKSEEWRNRITAGRSSLSAILEHPDTLAGQADVIRALDRKLAFSHGVQGMKRVTARFLTDLFPGARHIQFIGEKTVNFREDEWKNLTPSTLESYLDKTCDADVAGLAIHRAINRCNVANDQHIILDAIRKYREHLKPEMEAMLFNKAFRRFYVDFEPDVQTMNELMERCLSSTKAEVKLREGIIKHFNEAKYGIDSENADWVVNGMVPQMLKAWNSGSHKACNDFHAWTSNPDIDPETRLVLNLAALNYPDLITPSESSMDESNSEKEGEICPRQRFLGNLHYAMKEMACHPEFQTKYKPFIIESVTEVTAAVDESDDEIRYYPQEILRKILDSTPVDFEDLQRLFDIIYSLFEPGVHMEDVVKKLLNEAEKVGISAERMAYLYENCEGAGRKHAFTIAVEHNEGLYAIVNPETKRSRFAYHEECITLFRAALKNSDLTLRRMILNHIEKSLAVRPTHSEAEIEIANKIREILKSRSIIESGWIFLEGNDTKEFLDEILATIDIHKRASAPIIQVERPEQLDVFFNTDMWHELSMPAWNAGEEETLNIESSDMWVEFGDLKGFEQTGSPPGSNQGMEKQLTRKRERDEGESLSEAPSGKRPRIESQDSASSRS